MKGLQTLIVDKEMVLEAVQEYLDKSVTPNVLITSIVPINEYSSSNIVPVPAKFQITTKPKE